LATILSFSRIRRSIGVSVPLDGFRQTGLGKQKHRELYLREAKSVHGKYGALRKSIALPWMFKPLTLGERSKFVEYDFSRGAWITAEHFV